MTALPDYDSPLLLKAFLDSRGMAMQKKFGQNFLVNRTSRERLVDALDVAPGTKVWEIGPGLGAMTGALLDRGAELAAFEIDRGFCAALTDFYGERKNFTLVTGDVLANWKDFAEKNGVPDRLFGNLPYNIAAAIIGDMIDEGTRFDAIVVTVQKEVALRMQARPGTEDYSSFSVLCQWAYDVSTVMDLAGGCFWPRPNVTSRAVKLVKKSAWPECDSPAVFLSLLRGLFASRRKTVKNNLAHWLAASGKIPEGADPESLMSGIFAASGINPGARAETLALKDFLKLSDVVGSL